MGGGIANEMWMSDADDHVSEAALQRLIWDELEREPTLDPCDVRVEVTDVFAMLSGTVRSYPEKLAAERATDRVPGLQHVVNHIIVEPPDVDGFGDEEIAAAARAGFEWHVLVPTGYVTVTVQNGVVHLGGRVAAESQHRAALDLVAHLRGVRDVVDQVETAWASGEWHLGARVHDAIDRDGRLHGRRIQVAAHGSRVELHGRVRSLAERLEAEEVARGVPGVSHVDDYLRVSP
jgi:osmotically-inducible protein OsmY